MKNAKKSNAHTQIKKRLIYKKKGNLFCSIMCKHFVVEQLLCHPEHIVFRMTQICISPVIHFDIPGYRFHSERILFHFHTGVCQLVYHKGYDRKSHACRGHPVAGNGTGKLIVDFRSDLIFPKKTVTKIADRMFLFHQEPRLLVQNFRICEIAVTFQHTMSCTKNQFLRINRLQTMEGSVSRPSSGSRSRSIHPVFNASRSCCALSVKISTRITGYFSRKFRNSMGIV